MGSSGGSLEPSGVLVSGGLGEPSGILSPADDVEVDGRVPSITSTESAKVNALPTKAEKSQKPSNEKGKVIGSQIPRTINVAGAQASTKKGRVTGTPSGRGRSKLNR